MSASVDTKQLRQHAFTLQSSGQIAPTAVEAVTRLAAARVRGMAQQTLSGSKHWFKIPPNITYDVKRSGLEIEAEIGRKRGTGGQGALMHLTEYGSSRSGPLRPALGPALDANAEPYERALLAAATATLGAGVGRMGRLSKP